VRPFPKGGGRFLLCALSYATVTNSSGVLGSPAHQVPQLESRELKLELGKTRAEIKKLTESDGTLYFFTQSGGFRLKHKRKQAKSQALRSKQTFGCLPPRESRCLHSRSGLLHGPARGHGRSGSGDRHRQVRVLVAVWL